MANQDFSVINMLLNDLSTVLAGFLGLVLILCAYCVFYVIRLGHYCRGAVEYVQTQNKKAVTLRRMAEVEASLTDLTDSYEALLAAHKKLRSRINMRAVREDRKNDADSAANGTDKRALRQAARDKNLL